MKITQNGDKVNLSMVRGDTESITVSKTSGFDTGDTVTFTVRRDVGEEIQLQKIVTEFGKYVYDIEWVDANNNYRTIVEKSGFELRDEVTY